MEKCYTDCPRQRKCLQIRLRRSGAGDGAMKTKLEGMGLSVLSGSPADFRGLMASETEKWARVVKFAGIKAQQDGEPMFPSRQRPVWP